MPFYSAVIHVSGLRMPVSSTQPGGGEEYFRGYLCNVCFAARSDRHILSAAKRAAFKHALSNNAWQMADLSDIATFQVDEYAPVSVWLYLWRQFIKGPNRGATFYTNE